jgi:hypothetical protein
VKAPMAMVARAVNAGAIASSTLSIPLIQTIGV